jgi:hypothetical protein
MPSARVRVLLCLFVAVFLIGCGGGGAGGTHTPPSSPTFTSVPGTAAVEGSSYSYQLVATSSDASAITFSLTSGPTGATLSGNTLTWTPTHDQSRVADNFVVTATTPAGGSATQTWTVTPNGTINIVAVATYWTPTGSIDVPRPWFANVPYPAALILQSDGSLQRLQGAANPDGGFSIPNVPAGSYWLQINPNANYWTSTSDFDDGFDTIGRPPATTVQSTTTFAFDIGGTAPGTGYLFGQTDVQDLNILELFGAAGFTQLGFQTSRYSDFDWSKVTTLYFSEFVPASSGGFNGYVLGPTQTVTNVSLINGATNNIPVTLTPSPAASIPLSIQGTAWAATQTVGPGTPTIQLSDYSVFVQPFLMDRYAFPGADLLQVAPDFALLRPSPPSQPQPFVVSPPPYFCNMTTGHSGFPLVTFGAPPIVTDQNYGAISYGDPFPSLWPRYFQYCQISTLNLPRPNSSEMDSFTSVIKQTTSLPSDPVTPLLSPVQNPMLNGASLFQSATLSTTKLTLSWTAPATGSPFGYYISVYEFATLPMGLSGYVPAGRYGTSQTSLTVPFLSAGNTYVFTITANADAVATMDKAPLRSKIPIAESGIVSAPIVIAPGATFSTVPAH